MEVKKMKKVLALVLALSLVFVLVSCGKTLSGTYTASGDVFGLAGGKVSFTFSGSKVTVSETKTFLGNSSTEEYKGSYEITEADDGSMSIKFTFEDSDASKYAGTKTFKENKDAGTITIGMTTYTKQ